jgi:phosphohistidine phosphatase
MKTLVIVRHAKAETLPLDKTDFERKLTEGGKKDAEMMASIISKQISCTDVIISSPAKRAWSTAKRFTKAFNKKEEFIIVDKNIYEASADTLIELVQNIEDNFESAMIFGHNPGLSQLAYFFTGDSSLELPTCGVVIISLDVKHWLDVNYKKGKLISFHKP